MNNFYSIHPRLVEELRKIGNNPTVIAQKLKCDHSVVYRWKNNSSLPSAYYLALLDEAGCDVIYILTGRRTHHDKTRG